MAANEGAADATSLRDLAVARSLDPARVRAEKRVQRFLDAATELMSTSTGKDFTVQEVVERSGQSLRSFYQYFNGKHELLLALFEEALRVTAEQLAEAVDRLDDPLDRLHRFTIDYHAICRPSRDDTRSRRTKTLTTTAMGEFSQQLLSEHPNEAAQAFAPVITLLEQLLHEAVAAGAIRADLKIRRTAGVILQTIMFNTFATTISGSTVRADGGDPAEELWDLILHGITPR